MYKMLEITIPCARFRPFPGKAANVRGAVPMRLLTLSSVLGWPAATRKPGDAGPTPLWQAILPFIIVSLAGIICAISIWAIPIGGPFDDGVNYGLFAVTQLA